MVTNSVALVTRSEALVPNSFLPPPRARARARTGPSRFLLLVITSASLVVTSALLVVTRSYYFNFNSNCY